MSIRQLANGTTVLVRADVGFFEVRKKLYLAAIHDLRVKSLTGVKTASDRLLVSILSQASETFAEDVE